MPSFEFPDLEQRPAELQPDDPQVRATILAEDPLADLRGFLHIGGPLTRPLTEEDCADDAETREFLRLQRDEFTFHRLHLTCTPVPAEGHPFTKIWVEIKLTRSNDHQAAPPIGWSMFPTREADVATKTRTLALSPNLTFAHIGVSAQGQRQTTVAQQQPWILARFEKSARPTWEIRRTPSRQLDEMMALSLVIRAPRNTITIGHINLWAQIERRRLGITSYQVRSQPGALAFTIAPN